MSKQDNDSLLELCRSVGRHGEQTSSIVECFCANSCTVDCTMLDNTLADKTVDNCWEILMSEVRAQLRASDWNTRNCRASELQLLACSEAFDGLEDNFYPVDFVYPMDLVTVRQPGHDTALSYSMSSFVPISPMRSSRFTTPSTTASSVLLQSKSITTFENQMFPSPVLFVEPCSSHLLSSAHDQSANSTEQWIGYDIQGRDTVVNHNSSGASQSILPHKTNIEPKPRKAAKTSPRKKAAKPKPAAVIRPSRYDVLSGRGGAINKHEGNVWFRDEARKLRSAYRGRNTTRDDKIRLSQVRVSIVFVRATFFDD